MMYLVDFAGTLFDERSFATYDRTRTSGTPYAPGELARFLYPDASAFLREKENSAIIVTAMDKEQDADLIKSALACIPRTSVMYTSGVLKGDFLAPYISLYGSSPVFIDDSASHLASMVQHCPQARLVEMRRDGQEGDGRWPVARSFAELATLV